MFQWLKMLLTTAASVATVSCFLLWKFQLKLIYPSAMNNGRDKTDTPDMYDMEYEDVYLETPDKVKLHSFLLLQDASSPTYKNKTVMILCPNAGNIGHSLPIVEIFYKTFGYNVLIYSYRGYGQSTGVSNEKGLKIDANTVMKYVNEHKQLSHSSIILYGRSLGGAVSIYIASSNYINVRGIVLENTFLSIRKCIPHIFPFLKNFTFLCHQVWNSEQDITKIDQNVPVLFLCAELDEIVPPDHMRRLYDLSKSTKKKRIIFEGSHHNDTVLAPDYWNIIHDFTSSIDPMEK